MKTYPQSARRILAATLLVGLVSLLRPLFGADEPAPRQWFSVTFTEVKPDKVAEFERIQKEELIPALKKAGITERYAFTRAQFGQGNSYTFSTPIKDLGHYDNPSPMIAAIGQPALDALGAKLTACQVSTRTVAYRSLPAISVPAPASDERKVCILTVNHLTPGRKAEWTKYWTEAMVPAIKQAGLSGYSNYELFFGGDANEVVTLTWVKDFADIDKGPMLSRAIGAKAMSEITAKLPAGVIASTERSLMRSRAELSITPEKKPAAAK